MLKYKQGELINKVKKGINVSDDCLSDLSVCIAELRKINDVGISQNTTVISSAVKVEMWSNLLWWSRWVECFIAYYYRLVA